VKASRKTSSKVLEEADEYRVAKKPFRFIDLFCGIGGFHLAFKRLGHECVFASDWDRFSQQTYEANFGKKPLGDIHSVAVADIPAHDILCGGFPCQPFSLAGVSKKNSLGRKHGFDDEKQGNLFFSIADILDYHRPAAFVLENVKNLKSHDKGRTFDVIHRTLTEALGYTVYYKIIDAKPLVPQHRERIFLVGFREWPPGRDLPADADSGPIVTGVGAAATAFGLAAAREVGDALTAGRLATTARVLGSSSMLSRQLAAAADSTLAQAILFQAMP